jgi:protein SCO1
VKVCLVLAAVCLIITNVFAQPRTLPVPVQTEFEQHLNARLPLELRFINDDGKYVQLADYFGQRPVVLVLGYYHCRNLCSTLMEGAMQALSMADLPRNSYRLVGLSIDPTENAEIAAEKKRAYTPLFGAQDNVHFLTGKPVAIGQLTSAAGFQYAYDATSEQYVHPAGFIIATPDGHISRYFLGVNFSASELRDALTEAELGRVGNPANRLLLLCAHYDPVTGRYSITVMTWVRIFSLLILTLLCGWIYTHRMERRKR